MGPPGCPGDHRAHPRRRRRDDGLGRVRHRRARARRRLAGHQPVAAPAPVPGRQAREKDPVPHPGQPELPGPARPGTAPAVPVSRVPGPPLVRGAVPAGERDRSAASRDGRQRYPGTPAPPGRIISGLHEAAGRHRPGQAALRDLQAHFWQPGAPIRDFWAQIRCFAAVFAVPGAFQAIPAAFQVTSRQPPQGRGTPHRGRYRQPPQVPPAGRQARQSRRRPVRAHQSGPPPVHPVPPPQPGWRGYRVRQHVPAQVQPVPPPQSHRFRGVPSRYSRWQHVPAQDQPVPPPQSHRFRGAAEARPHAPVPGRMALASSVRPPPCRGPPARSPPGPEDDRVPALAAAVHLVPPPARAPSGRREAAVPPVPGPVPAGVVAARRVSRLPGRPCSRAAAVRLVAAARLARDGRHPRHPAARHAGQVPELARQAQGQPAPAPAPAVARALAHPARRADVGAAPDRRVAHQVGQVPLEPGLARQAGAAPGCPRAAAEPAAAAGPAVAHLARSRSRDHPAAPPGAAAPPGHGPGGPAAAAELALAGPPPQAPAALVGGPVRPRRAGALAGDARGPVPVRPLAPPPRPGHAADGTGNQAAGRPGPGPPRDTERIRHRAGQDSRRTACVNSGRKCSG